jgi:AcrR family transcriptional regulator
MLLQSALELFGANGFHATSVQEIVKAAGLTKGAFYHHFASKEDVLRLIHDEFLEVQVGLVDEILETYDSPVDQLRALVRTSVLSVARYQAHVAVFFQERRYLTGERGADVKRRRDSVEQKMEEIVRRGIAAGDFSPEIDARIAIFGIVGMTAWVHQWYRPGGQLSAETIADELAQLTLDGLLRTPAK